MRIVIQIVYCLFIAKFLAMIAASFQLYENNVTYIISIFLMNVMPFLRQSRAGQYKTAQISGTD